MITLAIIDQKLRRQEELEEGRRNPQLGVAAVEQRHRAEDRSGIRISLFVVALTLGMVVYYAVWSLPFDWVSADSQRTREYLTAVESTRKRAEQAVGMNKDHAIGHYTALAEELDRLPTAGVASAATRFGSQTSGWLRTGAYNAYRPNPAEHRDWLEARKLLDAQAADLRARFAEEQPAEK